MVIGLQNLWKQRSLHMCIFSGRVKLLMWGFVANSYLGFSMSPTWVVSLRSNPMEKDTYYSFSLRLLCCWFVGVNDKYLFYDYIILPCICLPYFLCPFKIRNKWMAIVNRIAIALRTDQWNSMQVTVKMTNKSTCISSISLKIL